MKLEKFLVYFLLFLLLVIGLSLINLIIFLELKRAEEENLHKLAHSHYLIHRYNPQHRGDEEVLINPTSEKLYRAYTFEDPLDSFKVVRVGISPTDRINKFMQKLLVMEFLLTLTLIFLYQTIIESYTKRLKEKEDWVKNLMLSLTHRLGNFIATQRVLVSLLKKHYSHDKNLQRMEKSLLRAQRDFSLFTNLIRENRSIEKKLYSLKEFILESLSYFEDELKNKRIHLGLRDLYVYMDKTDLEDVIYNLLGNAIRYSSSFLHVKVCPKSSLLIIRNDTSITPKQGMGMGSELVRRVLESYGYRIRVSIRKSYTVFVFFSTK
ncbi:MAG: hypothetical protein ACK4OF_00265 [Aquificaceae bacterium]